MKELFGQVIFCEDIRDELTGQKSYIGVYEGGRALIDPQAQQLTKLTILAFITILDATKIQDVYKLNVVKFHSDGNHETIASNDLKFKKSGNEIARSVKSRILFIGLPVKVGDILAVFIETDDDILVLGEILLTSEKD